MRRDLLDILACPACKGVFDLSDEREEGEDIVSGTLTCRQCATAYPIEDGVPNMLPQSG